MRISRRFIRLGVAMLVAFSIVTPISVAEGNTTTQASQPSVVSPTMVQVSAGNGTQVTAFLPPPGFNPLTASNAELQAVGFPTRPSDPSDLSSWQKAMGSVKEVIVPTFKNGHKNTLKTGSLASANTGTSHNWSGYIANNGSNYSGYNYVKGTWAVAGTYNCFSGPQYKYSSSWIGIGGNGVNQLIQIGTESDQSYTTRTYVCQTGFYPWFEVLPKYAYQQTISNMYINPNDQMYATVSYSNGTAKFYMEDVTTGVVASFSDTGDSSDYNGSTAEWIVERTMENGQYPSLTDFQTDSFSSSYAGTLSEPGPYVIQDWPHTQVNMISCSGSTTLAAAGALSGGAFTDTWKNYGTTEYCT